MKLSEIPCLSFKALRRQLGLAADHRPMVEPTADSDFCHLIAAKGWLTEEQTTHAAMHYRLGRSKSGRTIFWMIDEWGIVRDGRIGEAWASEMLRRRAPGLLHDFHPSHCLFGQHLLFLEPDREICVVESEQSAVILSELMPDHIWLATMYPVNLNVQSFESLQYRSVMLYPKTDPVGDYYLAWLELADQAQRLYDINLSVSPLLEDHASPAQKEQRIDLVDFLTS